MAKRFKFWNKQDDLFTQAPDENGKSSWTAAEYIAKNAAWAANPAAKVDITTGAINCGMFQEWGVLRDITRTTLMQRDADQEPKWEAHKAAQGWTAWDDSWDDDLVLDLWEWQAENQPEYGPDAAERQAAALELQTILMMDDVEE